MNISAPIAAMLSLSLAACGQPPAAAPQGSIVIETHSAGSATTCPLDRAPPRHARGADGEGDGDGAGYLDLSAGFSFQEGQTLPQSLCAGWTVSPYVFDEEGQLVPSPYMTPFFFNAPECGTDQILGCLASTADGGLGNTLYLVGTASNITDCNGSPIASTLLATVATAAVDCVAGVDTPVRLTMPISFASP